MEFTEWIKEKLNNWRIDKFGREASISAFARYLGVSRDVLTGWLAGHNPEDKTYIDALIDKYGKEEVFTALGLPIPTEDDYLTLGAQTPEEAIEIIRRLAAQHKLTVEIHQGGVIRKHK